MDPIDHAKQQYDKKTAQLFKVMRKSANAEDRKTKEYIAIFEYLDSVDNLLGELTFELQKLRKKSK